MKRNLVIVFIGLLFTQFCRTQSFQGTIQYRVVCEVKEKTMSEFEMQSSLGNFQSYQFRGSDMLMTNNGKILIWQWYKADESRIYQKTGGQDKITYLPASRITDEIQKVIPLKKEKMILGKRCKGIQLHKYSGTFTYYYTADYAINPEIFKNLIFENWNQLFALIKAVPLQMIMENEQFKVVMTATQVRKGKTNDLDFQLPEPQFIEASPF